MKHTKLFLTLCISAFTSCSTKYHVDSVRMVNIGPIEIAGSGVKDGERYLTDCGYLSPNGKGQATNLVMDLEIPETVTVVYGTDKSRGWMNKHAHVVPVVTNGKPKKSKDQSLVVEVNAATNKVTAELLTRSEFFRKYENY
jgi:hypothetical protein